MSKVQTEDKRYIRDLNSKALLATDINALHKYRKQKEISKQKTLEYEELKQKVAKIDNDIEFIKQILLEQIDGSQRSVN